MFCSRLGCSAWGRLVYRRPIVNRPYIPKPIGNRLPVGNLLATGPTFAGVIALAASDQVERESACVALHHVGYFRLADPVDSANHSAQLRGYSARLFFLVQIQLHLEINVRPRHFPMIR